MTTIHARALVALLSAFLAGGCASSSKRIEGAPFAREMRDGLRFDNNGRDRVDVYLVGEARSWRLGRLEPGQARWLSLPRDIPGSDLGRLQLAVIANAAQTVDPLRDPRAVLTLRQPVAVLTGTRWGFVQGQLTTLRTR